MNDYIEEIYKDGNKGIRYNLHKGQTKAWNSNKRFVFVLAGTQSGKTVFGPIWLNREIKKRGDGEYLVVSPSFPLQQKKVLPVYEQFFKHYLKAGEYKIQERIFHLNKRGYNSKIFFGSADNADSLESCTAKAAHLDEVGQKAFRLSSWEAVLRRLSINKGRCLGTTTIYNLGWMKNEIYDRWRKGDKNIDVVQFASIMNPAFPKDEYERARQTLPTWKFNMFYKGLYDRPAGMIYNCFNEDVCKISPIPIDPRWPRYVGLDFGGVNTAAIWIAKHKVNKLVTNYYVYREYLSGGKSAAEHGADLKKLSKGENIVSWVGGSQSEDQWRLEFRTGSGIPVKAPPIKDVEVGIDRVYGLHKQDRIFVFNTCKGYLDEKTSYSRVLDDSGNPTEKIEDKEKYHRLDAERYIISHLIGVPPPAQSSYDPEPEQRRKLFG